MLLTTHYMAEADQMCDRISIIDRGLALACDTPAALRRSVEGGQHVELELRFPAGAPCPELDGVAAVWGAEHPERGTRTLKFRLPEGRALGDVLRALEAGGYAVHAVATRETSLEDAFIAIVGRGIDEHTSPQAGR